MKTAQNTAVAAVSVDFDTMPAHESDSICRTLIGSVSRLFENPAVMADYKRWKAERDQREKEQNNDT